MKTTRDIDLAELEEYRDSAETSEQKAQRQALLESVYHQSKDTKLEEIRGRLVEQVNRYFEATNSGNIKAMFESKRQIEAIRKEVKTYVATPGYAESTAKKMAKYNEQKAQAEYKKLISKE